MLPFGMQKWQTVPSRHQASLQRLARRDYQLKSSRINGPTVPVEFSGICQNKSKVEAQKHFGDSGVLFGYSMLLSFSPLSLSLPVSPCLSMPRASPRIQDCWLHKPTCLANFKSRMAGQLGGLALKDFERLCM